MASQVFTGDGIFELWSPTVRILKSSNSDSDKAKDGLFKGIASVETPDLEKQTVIQAGMKWGYFLKQGYFNYDHQDEDGPHEIVGEPLGIYKAKVKGAPATGLKGMLYMNQPRAKEIWRLCESIRKSGGKRQLGLSVQGDVIKQLGDTILECRVKHVAITFQPVHLSTTMHPIDALRKSLNGVATAGHVTASSGGGSLGAISSQSTEVRKKRRKKPTEPNLRFLSAFDMSFPGRG